jgi:hypothetical protein
VPVAIQPAAGRRISAAGLLAAAAVAAVVACSNAQPTAEQLAVWVKDSARYEAAMVAWRKREHVLDSIRRTVDASTLLRLRSEMIAAKNPEPYLRLVECEHARLVWTHGPAIMLETIDLVEDSLEHQFGKRAVKAVEQRLPSAGIVSIDGLDCHGNAPRRPSQIDGVSLIDQVPRPVPPRAPRGRKAPW